MRRLYVQQMKLGSSILESIQSGKLSQLQVTPKGINWLSRATVSYWLRKWDKIYDNIIENLKSDSKGKIGKKIANKWTGLIDEFFSVGSKPLAIGMILWQETSRQNQELDKELKRKSVPTPQELVKKVAHVKLLFNPEALSWISQALEFHAK
jgi:hypothetical protein